MTKNNLPKPTPQQLLWQEQELGVIIHYIMDIYAPHMTPSQIKSKKVRKRLHPSKINPTNLDVEQWIRSAHEMGAKYAVLVANHCTGFSLWQTKVNDYCTRSLSWKDGKGDIVADFIEACRKYDIKPGLYYSTTVNGYYDISDRKKHDYKAPYYQEYLRNVESQVTELWSQYGELFEIWFDGGIIPKEKGGPDLEPILKKYQPNAVCFQGPKSHPHNLRWVGNEEGLAPENCWATTNMGEADFDGTKEDFDSGAGTPDGKYYIPAETDTPNRSTKSFGGGWAWKKHQGHKVRSPEELLDCYIKSVGRNSNLLLGMAISPSGQFEDEEQFIAFGQLLKNTFSNPITEIFCEKAENKTFTLTLPNDRSGKYLVLREKIDEGQRIRGFKVSVDNNAVYESECVGHKRIIPITMPANSTVTIEITKAIDNWQFRDIAIY